MKTLSDLLCFAPTKRILFHMQNSHSKWMWKSFGLVDLLYRTHKSWELLVCAVSFIVKGFLESASKSLSSVHTLLLFQVRECKSIPIQGNGKRCSFVWVFWQYSVLFHYWVGIPLVIDCKGILFWAVAQEVAKEKKEPLCLIQLRPPLELNCDWVVSSWCSICLTAGGD